MENPGILQDRFGRVHDYLRLSLTERCNLRCFYCMPEEGIALRPRSSFMRQEEILQLAKTFVDFGVKKIRLTGGEPLIRKDIAEILAGLAALNVDLGITTNGVLVDRHIENFKAAGLKAVNVSLDSLNREKQARISRRDYFPRVMDNIQLLLDEGFDVKINAVIMKGVNENEVADFVAWTHDRELAIRFIEFMPFDGNDWNWDKKVSYGEMMEQVQGRFGAENIEKLPGQPHDTAENYRIKGFKGTFGLIATMTNPFCGTCNRIRLTADGKLKNCLFSGAETDLLGPLRAGEDVKALIVDSILNKERMRGGIESFENDGASWKNRSMVAIGG